MLRQFSLCMELTLITLYMQVVDGHVNLMHAVNFSYSTDNILENMTTNSVLQCTRRCSLFLECAAVDFQDDNSTCVILKAITMTSELVNKTQFVKHCVTAGEFRMCDFDLSVVSGELRGYIEVYMDGVWGTVGKDYWQEELRGPINAGVFCRSFGYSDGYPIYPLVKSTSHDTGPVIMDNVKCEGTEINLKECHHVTKIKCNSGASVLVRCF